MAGIRKIDTDQKCAPVCVSFLLAADGGLKKGVQDGVHACCIARGASKSSVGKGAWDERNAAINAAASSEWVSREERRSEGSDAVGGGESDGRGVGIGRLGFFVAEVGSGGRKRTLDVKPGMRRTTSFCMLRVFCSLIQLSGGERAMM